MAPTEIHNLVKQKMKQAWTKDTKLDRQREADANTMTEPCLRKWHLTVPV